jgi:hypothetical protein
VSPYDIYGSGNLYTTVGDLLKWVANFDHPVVGDSTLFARMQAIATLSNGDTSEYGLGLRRERRYRGARVSESTGSDPGYQAYLGRYPEHHVAVVVLCNAGSAASPTALAHGVADVVLGRALAPSAAPATQSRIALPVGALQARVGIYLQPTTRAVVSLVMRDSQLVFAGPAGHALIPLTENRFAVSDEAGDIVFADGPHAAYQRRIPGQQPLTFEWHEPAAPSLRTLVSYIGDYASPEIGGTIYHVTATDSTLLLRPGAADPFIARIAFADTFVSGGYTLEFTRSGGHITGFEVTNARMRRVKFTRSPQGR